VQELSAFTPPMDLVASARSMILNPGPHARSFGMSEESREVALLFERHGPMVYGRARRLLGSAEDAQEATQEVFVRVITGAERRPAEGDVVPWLCRITTNYCLNKLRDAQRRRVLMETRGKSTLNEPASVEPDLLAQARRLFARADERQAQAAVYVFIDGMSHDEASEMMGVSRRTVGNLLERFTAWAREQEVEPSARADTRRTS